MNISIKKLTENAIIPTKGSPGAAGYDLYSTENYILKPGERHLFKTNISIKIPGGHYGRIAPRSGLAFKNGIDVLAGVIDEDYLGDIGVILLNTSDYVYDENGDEYEEAEELRNKCFTVKRGDRIAQIIFEKYYNFDFVEIDKHKETDRGDGGFGSTGK